MKELNTSPMLFNITKYIFPLNELKRNVFVKKTLTKLNIIHNEIGAQGAFHLANALQRNQVKSIYKVPFFYYLIKRH